MRTGVCTVQQALTAEVASVLRHSLDLARRRGHAQVTPLHVAATLMSSFSSPSDLLRRACLRSQPHHPASHPLQCRALELCFNVALNRLPTTSPPSSGPLLPSPSSLSNSLIAALKRAQANQRRGCIELQQQQPLQQQQQPLLAIKVEMEQLMLSILDDPSVSRVMKEAGFSSSCVKSNLEEETSVVAQSSPLLFERSKDIIKHGRDFWQSYHFRLPAEQSPPLSAQPSINEDLRMVFDVMLRKEGRRTNTVVVGDSASMTEGLIAELMGRVERSEVPDELKHSSFINLQFSSVHLRLMSKGDVDLKLSDLRRTFNSLVSDRVGGGVIIYAGDLRWAVNREAGDGCAFNPVEHMISELGRLVYEFKSTIYNKVWLLATASYHTYMQCQMRKPSLEIQWALQAVVVPSGWLALSLQASSGLDSRVPNFSQSPLRLLQSKFLSSKEDNKLICCDECTFNFEKEALVFKSETSCWLQQRPESNHKESLLELRRKWNKICQSLHRSQTHFYPTSFNRSLISKNYSKSLSNSWWSSSLFSNQNKNLIEPHAVSFSSTTLKLNAGFSSTAIDKKTSRGNWQERDESKQWLSEGSLNSLKMLVNQQIKTTLALSNTLFSDSATSKDQTRQLMADPVELLRKLQENIPWQSETISSIVEAFNDCSNSDKKATRLLLQGSDHIAKRRLARIMAESFFGSTNKLIQIGQRTLSTKEDSCLEILTDALRKDPKCVVLVEDIDRLHTDFIKSFTEALKAASLEDPFGAEVSLGDAIFILTTSKSTKLVDANDNSNNVLKMRLHVEDESPTDIKRKSESDQQNKSKKPRTGAHGFDLNFQANEDSEEDAVPSDLTHETECRNLHLPHEFLQSTIQLTLDAGCEQSEQMRSNLLSKLNPLKDEKWQLFVDPAMMEELIQASGSFLESFFETWVREVFRVSLLSVEKGGKVRLSLEGKERNVEEFGFMGSVLPNQMLVD